MLLLLYSPTGVACPIPPIPDEGFVINFGRRYPVILEYYCNNGYVLKGNRTVKCLKNQTWDKQFPTCIGKLLLFFIVTILHSSYKLWKIYLYILQIFNPLIHTSRNGQTDTVTTRILKCV